MEKEQIAVFDFDGTLTTKDSFIEFIRFSKGDACFVTGLLLQSPFLMAFKLGLYPNWKAKQRLFSYFFKGMSYEAFCRYGIAFASRVESMLRKDVVERMQRFLSDGHRVFVITASIEEWVRPWCELHGVTSVLSTRAEVVDGVMTGRFSTPNCYGEEKLRRFLEVAPDRSSYVLTAYGDSRGDEALFRFADVATRIR